MECDGPPSQMRAEGGCAPILCLNGYQSVFALLFASLSFPFPLVCQVGYGDRCRAPRRPSSQLRGWRSGPLIGGIKYSINQHFLQGSGNMARMGCPTGDSIDEWVLDCLGRIARVCLQCIRFAFDFHARRIHGFRLHMPLSLRLRRQSGLRVSSWPSRRLAATGRFGPVLPVIAVASAAAFLHLT
ncbi:hypothetical protein B0H67DRAFT_382839 [Lasiosphaeris hirsuta]|uniref:Uncharacterized protein n=1 Tax=Lasiosphaeris hirsuta TaxID=260670 RepID=A0AA39ZXE8_9PEZI|nr:hypothetical protein B0H67DRAFT_382839 [Lasiosphaeris hirsuta]